MGLFFCKGSPIVKNVPSDNGTYTLPSIDATEGESIELHCPIVGAPQPEMSWWKDGELICNK